MLYSSLRDSRHPLDSNGSISTPDLSGWIPQKEDNVYLEKNVKGHFRKILEVTAERTTAFDRRFRRTGACITARSLPLLGLRRGGFASPLAPSHDRMDGVQRLFGKTRNEYDEEVVVAVKFRLEPQWGESGRQEERTRMSR